MNAKQRMYERIEKHGQDLKRIFPAVSNLDAVKVSKKVRALEVKAQWIALDYCNGTIDGDTIDTQGEKIMAQLDKFLDYTGACVPVFFNRDPRGYALKIDDEYVRTFNVQIHMDWGGYGIIAPEYDGRP